MLPHTLVCGSGGCNVRHSTGIARNARVRRTRLEVDRRLESDEAPRVNNHRLAGSKLLLDEGPRGADEGEALPAEALQEEALAAWRGVGRACTRRVRRVQTVGKWLSLQSNLTLDEASARERAE